MFKKLLGAILLILCIFSVGCAESKLDNIITGINGEDIYKAIEKYEKLEVNEKIKIDNIVKGLIDEQYQMLIEKKISYYDFDTETTKLKKFDGVSDYAKDIHEKGWILNNSRKNFEDAKLHESKGEIIDAINRYWDVDELDSENYEVAQKKITELKQQQLEQQLQQEIAENKKLAEILKGKEWISELGEKKLIFGEKLEFQIQDQSVSLDYQIISDKETKDMILNDFKDKYILNLEAGNFGMYKYNFTDDMINNSVIVKFFGENGAVMNNLYIFNEDRNSFEDYTLLYEGVDDYTISKVKYNKYYLFKN